MKTKMISYLFLLGFCLFCGFICIAIGLGSVYTPVNRIAGPIVCGSRQMDIVQHTYSYRPGENTWTVSIYCVDSATGEKQELSLLVQFVSGVIYGAALFVVILVVAGAVKLWRSLVPGDRKTPGSPAQ